jgi:uncharacterized repeat protein (TIGR04042 family)
MPEVMFKVKWPDGRIDDCYSPSTVISDYLKEGKSYSVKDFVELSSQALNLASERVFKKYGFRCTSAEAQLSKILAIAKTFTPDQSVDCLSLE